MTAPSAASVVSSPQTAAREEVRLASRQVAPGLGRIDVSIPGMHCAGCIRTIERGLATLPEVEDVRVNLSTKRASVTWRGTAPPDLLAALNGLGFPGHLTQPEEAASDPEFVRLVRALAVAGVNRRPKLTPYRRPKLTPCSMAADAPTQLVGIAQSGRPRVDRALIAVC